MPAKNPTTATELTESMETTKLLAEDKEPTVGSSGERPQENVQNSGSRSKLLITIAVLVQSSAVWISYGIIAPFFPSEAAKKGATPTETGFIFGVFQLTMFFTSPLYGKYIQKIGVKSTFLYGSFLLGGCSIVLGLMGYAPGGTVFVVMCILSRIVEANGAAMTTTANSTILMHMFPENIGRAQGIQKTVIGIAIVIGPSVGSGLYAVGGYQLPFMVVGGLVWLIALLCYFILPAIEREGDATRQGNYSITHLIRIPGCIFVYFSVAVCYLTITYYEPILGPFMQKEFRTMSVAQIGLLFMITPGVFALTTPIAGWLSDKGWLGTPPIVGLMLQGVSFLLLGPLPWWNAALLNTLAIKCVALMITGCGTAFALIPAYSHMLSLIRSHGMDEGLHTLGLISGITRSALSLGGFLGPTLAGFLTHLYGFPVATSMCGVLNLIYAIVFAAYILGMLLNGKWPIVNSNRDEENETDSLLSERGSLN